MRKKGGKNGKKINSKSIVRTGLAYKREARTEQKKREIEAKAKRRHKKNRKRIEGKRKDRQKERNTDLEVSLDPYQKEGV